VARLVVLPAGAPPDAFPPADAALADPPGLLCVGGDLAPARLLAAYRRGIFPWFEAGQPILWWSPDPRAVFRTGAVHVSRRLRRTLRSDRYATTVDADFRGVLHGCASAPGRAATWITPAMAEAYGRLHELGHAHSVETWCDDRLVGGIYGVAIGRMFFGESMFALVPDASKVALLRLAHLLATAGCPLLDCQLPSAHLASLGSELMPRPEFLAALAPLVVSTPAPHPWPQPRQGTRELA
jgi:leucyl/phenylalanyl-tRNA--protein transferase